MAMGPVSMGESLKIRAFHIDRVIPAAHFEIQGNTLHVSKTVPVEAGTGEVLEAAAVEILAPGSFDINVPSILDIIPIATKVLGYTGTGITHTLTGVYLLLAAADAGGSAPAQFGSSAGLLGQKMLPGRAGTPGAGDHLIILRVTLAAGWAFSREGIMTAHRCAELYLQPLRNCLKKLEGRNSSHERVFRQNTGREKDGILIVKLLTGQGAMHDNLLLPREPGGVTGGRSIIDLGNMPLYLTANEYRDGALRAL